MLKEVVGQGPSKPCRIKTLTVFFFPGQCSCSGERPAKQWLSHSTMPSPASAERQIRQKTVSNVDHAANDPCSDIDEVDCDLDKTCTCRPVRPSQLQQLQFLTTEPTERLIGFVSCTKNTRSWSLDLAGPYQLAQPSSVRNLRERLVTTIQKVVSVVLSSMTVMAQQQGYLEQFV